MTRLSLDACKTGSAFIVTPVGHVDGDDIDSLIALGRIRLDDAHVDRLVVDLAEVEFMASTGLGALVQLRNAALDAGKSIELRNPRDPVRKILKITALDEAFAIDPPTSG